MSDLRLWDRESLRRQQIPAHAKRVPARLDQRPQVRLLPGFRGKVHGHPFYLFAGSVLENQDTHTALAYYQHRWCYGDVSPATTEEVELTGKSSHFYTSVLPTGNLR